LAKAGQGPRTFTVGNRTMISAESAREWCRAREELESAKL
jgi:hypothetical protein